MDFKAAMFDFDGTITRKGEYVPPRAVVDALVDLSQKIPIGFCTGRQLESFEHRGLNELLKEIEPEKRKSFLENLFLFAENGAIGYDFNAEKEIFEEFYRVEWPEEFIVKSELKETLRESIKDYGDVYDDAHRVVIVMRTNAHDEGNAEEIYMLSEKLYEITLKILGNFSQNFEKFLHAGNSGIGVIVGPANGDKDYAITKFAELLSEKRRLNFEEDLRDILVVGDSPQKGGNDHYFLRGKYATAYTVGQKTDEAKYPIPVMDESGKKLFNADGTLYLLKQLLT